MFGLGELGLENQRPAEGTDGLVEVPAFGEGDGHVVEDDGVVGGDGVGFPVVFDGFPEFFLAAEGEA